MTASDGSNGSDATSATNASSASSAINASGASHAVGVSHSAGAGEMLVAKDEAEHAAFAAELMARAIAAAVQERGVARIALSGGTTPSEAYRRLAAMDLPWPSVDWFWIDERAVAPDHPRSNYASARHDLGLDRMPPERVHRMEADSPDLEAAASRYERRLRRTFGFASSIAFDVITLGVGDDGHTASLFPGLGLTAIDDRLVIAVPEQPDKKLEPRLTVTAPVIHEARVVLVLARGASKRAVIDAARKSGSEEEMPSRTIQRSRGRVLWVVDSAAAGEAAAVEAG